MTNTAKLTEIATRLGITPEQVTEVVAFDAAAITRQDGGTTTVRTLYSPEDLADAGAERDLATELANAGLRACCGLPGEVHCR